MTPRRRHGPPPRRHPRTTPSAKQRCTALLRVVAAAPRHGTEPFLHEPPVSHRRAAPFLRLCSAARREPCAADEPPLDEPLVDGHRDPV